MPAQKKSSAAHVSDKSQSAKAQPLIAVRDVPASSRWYAQLLDAQPTSRSMKSDHAHLYDRLICGGALVLQLHAWDEEDHPNLVNAKEARPGHGVVLWFELAAFDDAVERIRAMKAKVLIEPRFNPAPGHREIWIQDPDGYVVVIASPDGEAG